MFNNMLTICKACSSKIFICEENFEAYPSITVPRLNQKNTPPSNLTIENHDHKKVMHLKDCDVSIFSSSNDPLNDNDKDNFSEDKEESLNLECYSKKSNIDDNNNNKKTNKNKLSDLKEDNKDISYLRVDEDISDLTIDNEENSKENVFRCKFCKFTSSDDPEFMNHMETRHSSKIPHYACDHCDLKFLTIFDLTSHLNEAHVGSSRYLLGRKQSSRGPLYVYRKKSAPVCEKHVSVCSREPFVTHKPFK